MSSIHLQTSSPETVTASIGRSESAAAKTARIVQSVALAGIALAAGAAVTYLYWPLGAATAISAGSLIGITGLLVVCALSEETIEVRYCNDVHHWNDRRDVVWIDSPRTIVTPAPLFVPSIPVYRPSPVIPRYVETVHPGQGHIAAPPRYQPAPDRTIVPPMRVQTPTVHPGQGHIAAPPRATSRPPEVLLIDQMPSVHPGQGHIAALPRR